MNIVLLEPEIPANAYSLENLKEAMDRMARFIEHLRG